MYSRVYSHLVIATSLSSGCTMMNSCISMQQPCQTCQGFIPVITAGISGFRFRRKSNPHPWVHVKPSDNYKVIILFHDNIPILFV